MMEHTGSITKPRGFLAAGVRAGIKEKGEDLALIFSERPASIAGVFTKNLFKAAPIQICIPRIPRATARAIVANSGNANACTGEGGIEDARRMIAEVASRLNLAEEDVFVASTGIIGRRLPMEKIVAGIDLAVSSLSKHGGADAARAIMTTDTHPKEVEVEFDVGGIKATIGGIAKGAGMICPNMATMLAFITTDIAITPAMLQTALSRSAEVSFNCLTVDGDTSTNDCVFVLANGMAGNSIIEADGKDFQIFQQHLDSITINLARQIAADGEGATKSISVTVKGARSYEDCRQIAKTIANSPLVKTAMFGCDPNWGRIVAAAGRAGVEFDPKAVSLCFGDISILKNGEPVNFSEAKAHNYLSSKDVEIILNVGDEKWCATVWTCDFSYDYVKINAEYHT
ncbi:MAG: bifunctional glutamate N-acetyltransferase/amino-acid acetyltransferase ArgJ [Armatimonadota bacterium]|nr:bifunctional glutamate N-acetyltransferase/amino-acid acetyltransferase ArgJ [Armatimonadota bacterium]